MKVSFTEQYLFAYLNQIRKYMASNILSAEKVYMCNDFERKLKFVLSRKLGKKIVH